MATKQRSIEILSDKKILSYPSNLGNVDKDPYGQDEQYMLIKINTDTKSTRLSSTDEKGNLVQDKVLGNTVVTNNRTGVGQGMTAENTDESTAILHGKAATDKQKWRTQKGMVSLDRVIVLPMPREHSLRTSISFDDDYDPSLLTKAGDIANQGVKDLGTDAYYLGKSALSSFIMNRFKSGVTSTDAMLAEERLMLNPKKEVMFKSFGYRKFSFNYLFAPKNAKESDDVEEIIRTLRYYALPEITPAKIFYIFPSEFEISFMLGQKENPHIPKITTSVLTNVNINYTPKNLWATLPNGAPLAMSMTLDFLELELVDRKRVFDAESKITSGY